MSTVTTFSRSQSFLVSSNRNIRKLTGAIAGLRVLRSMPFICLWLSLSMTGLGADRAAGGGPSIAPRYIASTGNDAAAGTIQAPWKTLQHAADRAVPGSQFHVRPGHYAGFQLTRSGASEAPIVFLADSGAIIDTPGPTDDGINLEGASYVVIEGFEVSRAGRAGIRSVVNHHVTIRKNRTDQNGMWGIFSGYSDYIVIENNVTTRSHNEHGIYVSSATDHPVIRENQVWGNRVNGIHLNSGTGQLVTGALVERNTIFDNGAGGGSGINADGLQKSLIQSNLLYGNHGSGISLYRDTGDRPAFQNAIVNNTVVQPADGRWALNIQNASTGNTACNNILLHESRSKGSICVAIDCLDGFHCDHNILSNGFSTNRGITVMDLQKWRQATRQDRDSIIAAPKDLFVNAGSHDFHQVAASPSIGAGTWYRTPALDLDGNTRPLARPDIGALQHPRSQSSDSTPASTDHFGPQLIGVLPSGIRLAPIERVQLVFSEELRRETLLAKDIQIAGPGGPVEILGIEPVEKTDYAVTFVPQSTPGAYVLRLAPAIVDPAGNPVTGDATDPVARKESVEGRAALFTLVDSLRFSFAPRTSSVPDDYLRVSETTGYSSHRGYGWLAGNVQSVDTEIGPALTRNLNYGPQLHFAVDVPNGDYEVAVTMGNAKYEHDQMAIFIQETKVDTVSTAAGQFHEKSYPVAVADRQIRVLLRDLGGRDPNVVINSLVVSPVRDPSLKTSRREVGQ